MDIFLEETEFMDFSHDVIQSILEQLHLNGLSDVDKAEKLFYYVRDSMKYSVKNISMSPEDFKASHVLQQDQSFCIPKAIALATLGRAVGIPSRIHMVDFINHRLSPGLVELWGTNVMSPHSFTEMYLEGQWIKLTPALDKKTCDQHGFITPEFKRGQHSMLHPVDRHGNPHVEYIRDHGTFADLPIDKIREILAEVYGNGSSDILKKILGQDIEAFE